MRAFPLAAVTVLFAVLAFPAFAQKGGDHGNGNPGKGHSNPGAADNRGPSQQDNRGQAQAVPGSHDSFVVVDRDRTAVSSYYRDEFARGNCPPGLAKKDNGCLPPGHYPLPQPLYSQLTPPPLGYEYVRVDDDVLLMQTTNRSVLNLVVNLR
jgi:hypothetical protein